MSHLIPFSTITLSPNRQRQDFDRVTLMELAESIKTHSLLHPIVLRDGNVLVAGERRLRAVEMLGKLSQSFSFNGSLVPPGAIPCVNLGELPPLAAEEAELEENIRRRDLTWQELASARARLHQLRCAQAAARGEVQTLTDTAAELQGGRAEKIDITRVGNSLIVARHLSNPEVASAPDFKSAVKAIKRIAAREEHSRLAEEVGRAFTFASHTLVLDDCLAWMQGQPDGRFDVILADPPYGMNADEFGDGGGKLSSFDHAYKDDYLHWKYLLVRFAQQAFLIAKPRAHLYIFCDIDRFVELREIVKAAGWTPFRTPLVDYKLDSGRVPLPAHGPRRQYELILFANKGAREVNYIGSDVIPSRLVEKTWGHGAQKPIDLYTELLKRSCSPGDFVLDPFAGTGTIFPAAHVLKVYATGVEQSQEYYGICLQRLAELEEGK